MNTQFTNLPIMGKTVKASRSNETGGLEKAHMPRPMKFVGRDYVTQRLNGKRCHHKLIYVCEICQAEKRYFANLMPRNKEPICTGFSQYLAGKESK